MSGVWLEEVLRVAGAGPAASGQGVDGFGLGFILAFDSLHLARQNI